MAQILPRRKTEQRHRANDTDIAAQSRRRIQSATGISGRKLWPQLIQRLGAEQERIRVKIAASRKMGMWMGGPPPLGYDVRDKKLVINATEAEQVRKLFAAYLEVGSVKGLTAWAARQGIVTKLRTRPDASVRSGGRPFSRGNLHALLRYRTYIGEVQHQGQIYPGEQEAIIDKDVWDRVQAQLQRNGSSSVQLGRSSAPASSLAGILHDETGDRLRPTHATKAGRRYLYYVSMRLIEGDAADRSGWRLAAHRPELTVCNCVTSILANKNGCPGCRRQNRHTHQPADQSDSKECKSNH